MQSMEEKMCEKNTVGMSSLMRVPENTSGHAGNNHTKDTIAPIAPRNPEQQHIHQSRRFHALPVFTMTKSCSGWAGGFVSAEWYPFASVDGYPYIWPYCAAGGAY